MELREIFAVIAVAYAFIMGFIGGYLWAKRPKPKTESPSS